MTSTPTAVTHHGVLDFARLQFPTLDTPPLQSEDKTLPDGEEERFDNSDQTLFTCVWNKGNRHGNAISYCSNRRIHIVPFRNNMREGTEKIYDMDGKLVYEAGWKANSMQGIVKWLDPFDGTELYSAEYVRGHKVVGSFTMAGNERNRELGLRDTSEFNTDMVVRLLMMVISGTASSPRMASSSAAAAAARRAASPQRERGLSIPILTQAAPPPAATSPTTSRFYNFIGGLGSRTSGSGAPPAAVPPLNLNNNNSNTNRLQRTPSAYGGDNFTNNRSNGSNSSLNSASAAVGGGGGGDDDNDDAVSTVSCPPCVSGANHNGSSVNMNGSGGGGAAVSHSRPSSNLVTRQIPGVDYRQRDEDVARTRAAAAGMSPGPALRRVTDPYPPHSPTASPPLSPTRVSAAAHAASMGAAASSIVTRAENTNTSPGRSRSPSASARRAALILVQEEEVPPEDVVITPLELRTDAAARFKRGIQRVTNRRSSTSGK